MEQEPLQQYTHIHIGARTGEITGYRPHGWTEFRAWRLRESHMEQLVEGGYIIDNRPLADHPMLHSWVICAPLHNGCLEGDDIDRMSKSMQQSARDLMPGLEGAYQEFAYLAAMVREPADGSAGAFDRVSSAYLARYWGSRGAIIGKRVGDMVYWSNGHKQLIYPKKETLQGGAG